MKTINGRKIDKNKRHECHKSKKVETSQQENPIWPREGHAGPLGIHHNYFILFYVQINGVTEYSRSKTNMHISHREFQENWSLVDIICIPSHTQSNHRFTMRQNFIFFLPFPTFNLPLNLNTPSKSLSDL